MRAELRAQRHLDKLKATGVEFTEEEEAAIYQRFMQERSERTNEDNEASREAEAVLALVAYKELFTYAECKRCDGLFVKSYANVAYCSNACRQSALEDIGIVWNPRKPPELRWEWKGDPWIDDKGLMHNLLTPAPLIVSPAALKVVANKPEVRQRFLAEAKQEQEPVPEPQPEPLPVDPKPEPQDGLDAGQRLLAALGG